MEESQNKPMPTDIKRQAVTELAELLRSSSAMAVADYRGLKVSDMQAVRRTLRDSGVQLTIAKNRLLKIAADEADRAELKPLLEGPTALATIDGDEAAMAKALAEALRPYARTGISVRGGMLGNRAIDASQLTRLATLPSRDVLLAQDRRRDGRTDDEHGRGARGEPAQPRQRAERRGRPETNHRDRGLTPRRPTRQENRNRWRPRPWTRTRSSRRSTR